MGSFDTRIQKIADVTFSSRFWPWVKEAVERRTKQSERQALADAEKAAAAASAEAAALQGELTAEQAQAANSRSEQALKMRLNMERVHRLQLHAFIATERPVFVDKVARAEELWAVREDRRLAEHSQDRALAARSGPCSLMTSDRCAEFGPEMLHAKPLSAAAYVVIDLNLQPAVSNDVVLAQDVTRACEMVGEDGFVLILNTAPPADAHRLTSMESGVVGSIDHAQTKIIRCFMTIKDSGDVGWFLILFKPMESQPSSGLLARVL